MHICTYFGNKLICFGEHVQSATEDRVFHSFELEITILTSQGAEEVPCIDPRLSYKQSTGEVKEVLWRTKDSPS
jgi:hypothetical protein